VFASSAANRATGLVIVLAKAEEETVEAVVETKEVDLVRVGAPALLDTEGAVVGAVGVGIASSAANRAIGHQTARIQAQTIEGKTVLAAAGGVLEAVVQVDEVEVWVPEVAGEGSPGRRKSKDSWSWFLINRLGGGLLVCVCVETRSFIHSQSEQTDSWSCSNAIPEEMT